MARAAISLQIWFLIVQYIRKKEIFPESNVLPIEPKKNSHFPSNTSIYSQISFNFNLAS